MTLTAPRLCFPRCGNFVWTFWNQAPDKPATSHRRFRSRGWLQTRPRLFRATSLRLSRMASLPSTTSRGSSRGSSSSRSFILRTPGQVRPARGVVLPAGTARTQCSCANASPLRGNLPGPFIFFTGADPSVYPFHATVLTLAIIGFIFGWASFWSLGVIASLLATVCAPPGNIDSRIVLHEYRMKGACSKGCGSKLWCAGARCASRSLVGARRATHCAEIWDFGTLDDKRWNWPCNCISRQRSMGPIPLIWWHKEANSCHWLRSWIRAMRGFGQH